MCCVVRARVELPMHPLLLSCTHPYKGLLCNRTYLRNITCAARLCVCVYTPVLLVQGGSSRVLVMQLCFFTPLFLPRSGDCGHLLVSNCFSTYCVSCMCVCTCVWVCPDYDHGSLLASAGSCRFVQYRVRVPVPWRPLRVCSVRAVCLLS